MLNEEMHRYTELSGNNAEHESIQTIGAYLDGYDDGYDKGISDVRENITAHKVIGGGEHYGATQQWTPCSERLPENEDTYLVMLDKSNLLDNETQVTDAYWINSQWQYGVLESYEHRMPKLVIEPLEELKVIAWMPLPEPYKGEEA